MQRRRSVRQIRGDVGLKRGPLCISYYITNARCWSEHVISQARQTGDDEWHADQMPLLFQHDVGSAAAITQSQVQGKSHLFTLFFHFTVQAQHVSC